MDEKAYVELSRCKWASKRSRMRDWQSRNCSRTLSRTGVCWTGFEVGRWCTDAEDGTCGCGLVIALGGEEDMGRWGEPAVGGRAEALAADAGVVNMTVGMMTTPPTLRLDENKFVSALI